MARAAKGFRGGGGRRFAFVLLGIFVLALGVIARRTMGINQVRALRQLSERRDAADAERVKLEAEIREASSRARLGPVVEQRLHMYVPADSQVIILPRPTSRQP